MFPCFIEQLKETPLDIRRAAAKATPAFTVQSLPQATKTWMVLLSGFMAAASKAALTILSASPSFLSSCTCKSYNPVTIVDDCLQAHVKNRLKVLLAPAAPALASSEVA